MTENIPNPRPRPRKTDAQVNEIRERCNIDGEKYESVAEEMGMTRMGVYLIARGLRRKRVPLSERMQAWVATRGRQEPLSEATRQRHWTRRCPTCFQYTNANEWLDPSTPDGVSVKE